MRAVKGNLATPLNDGMENRKANVPRVQSMINQATLDNKAGKEGIEPDDLPCAINARLRKTIVGRAQCE